MRTLWGSLALGLLVMQHPVPVFALPVLESDFVIGFEGTDLTDVITDADLGPGLVQALADADGLFTPLLGEDDFDASVTAVAGGTGIDARAGEDDLTRSSATNVAADASATGAAADGSIVGEASVAAISSEISKAERDRDQRRGDWKETSDTSYRNDTP